MTGLDHFEFVTPTPEPTANLLLYGGPKTGKSIGAGTAPKPIFYINADIGNSTRQVHLRNPPINGVPQIREPKLPDLVPGQRPLFGFMVQVMNMLADPNASKRIKTIVIDPIGEFYRRLLEEFSNYSVRPTLPTYGEVTLQVERFCRALCKTPGINTIIICHELLQQNGEELVTIPYTGTKAGSADLGQKLQAMVDIIGYTAVQETEQGKSYSAQLIPLKGRSGGDRFACLGDWQPLNISDWVEKIKEYERTLPAANVGTGHEIRVVPTMEQPASEAAPAKETPEKAPPRDIVAEHNQRKAAARSK